MTLVWTLRARQALARIWDYVAQDDSEAATRLVLRLADRAEALVDFPAMGRVVPEYARDSVRELVEGNYLIVYRARDDDVEILTVYEGHRLFPSDETPDDLDEAG